MHPRLVQNLKESWLEFRKIDIRNLASFHQSTWKSPNWDLDGIALSKVKNVWVSNLQGNCVSWQWRMMQNLKRNWLVSSKLTWEIWRILTWALENLKNLHFNGLLLNKVHNVWAKKSIGEFCLMALNIDATFEGKLNCAFKNDMRNLANFHQRMFESLKIGTWWDPFIQSRICMSFNFTREFCVMTMKNDTKLEKELTCQFNIGMRNLPNFDPTTRKSQKFTH